MARIYLELRDGPAGRLPDCPAACYGSHPARLWIIRRKLADTFGHWPVYRIGGTRQVVDGSLPHTVDTLPRDARELPPEVVARLWHEDNESHTFGGPNVAAMLRAAIREANGGR